MQYKIKYTILVSNTFRSIDSIETTPKSNGFKAHCSDDFVAIFYSKPDIILVVLYIPLAYKMIDDISYKMFNG